MTLRATDRPWRARTVAIADPGALADRLDDDSDIAWLREGDGVVGLGIAARAVVAGPEAAERWWDALCGGLEHETEMPGTFGTGPLAFGSFVFDDRATQESSVVVVPRTIVGRRAGLAWLTTLRRPGEEHDPPGRGAARRAPGRVTLGRPTLDDSAWTRRVAILREKLAEPGSTLHEVVLARAVSARAEQPVDPRWLVHELAESYPQAWTYHVEGLVGASPDLLVRREGGLVTSRVLAGAVPRDNPGDDAGLEVELVRSDSAGAKHRFALESVTRALAPYCSALHVPEAPYVARFPNLLQLASDLAGVVDASVSALQLAGRLHPGATVCGTPVEAAKTIIAQNEVLDRGRYAGPVGWVDANGDGEWVIALRCGRLDPDDPRLVTLYGGSSVVAASEPGAELAEIRAKLRPMLEALGVPAAAISAWGAGS